MQRQRLNPGCLSTVNMYIAKPQGNATSGHAVLYLTDVFGIQLLQNKL